MEFSDEYLRCRHALISLDKDRHHGGLVRCHLPSGKVVWLCEAHRRREGGTALSDDAVDATLTEPAATDDLMVREIRARTRWDETAKGPTGTHSAKSTKAAETQQKKRANANTPLHSHASPLTSRWSLHAPAHPPFGIRLPLPPCSRCLASTRCPAHHPLGN